MPEEFAHCLTIGEVAAAAGLRTSAIRYYESVGLLPEPERVSGQRRYSRDVLTLLSFIDVGQRAGFSLDEIRELIEGSAHDEASLHLQEIAQRKLPDVEALIVRAEAMKTWLETTAHCGCATFDVCALFGADATRALGSAPQPPQRSPAKTGRR